tara:strand:+ start:269 stop:1591 length:1323 start_codon:yes stop_codon:yes gene_type:complete
MALTQIKTLGLADGTDGQILTYDANGVVTAVGPGSDGQVLTSTGAGSPPAFENAAASVGGASGVDFNDDVKIRLGTGNDLEIYHSGSIGVINNGANGTAGHLVIRGDDIYLQGSNTSEELAHFVENGAVELYYDNVKTFETAANGTRVLGPEGGDGIIRLYADEGDDDADKWRLNALASSSTFTLQNAASGSWETNIECNGNGNIELYYDNSKKLETDTDGIKVFNNIEVNTNGSSIAENNLRFQSSGKAYIDHATTGQDIDIRTSVSSSLDTTGITIKSAGNLAFASGKGIDFSATGNGDGSMGNELFDDYEEGTFTAVMGGADNHSSYNVTANTAYYTKVGRVVHIFIAFEAKDINNSADGEIRISGLPYTAASGGGWTTNFSSYNVVFNTAKRQQLYISGANIYGLESTNNSSWTTWPISDFHASSMYLRINMTYGT